MSKGKTNYQFSVADSVAAEQVIQNWLTANGFQLFQENGENYYKSGDMMVGYRFFEYSINGSQVVIYAYLGSHDKPRELSDQLAGAIPITAYKNALAPLFDNLGNGVSASIAPTPSYNATNTTSVSGNEFQQSINKRQTTFAEISFWISILLLVMAFFGISMSAILVLVNYCLAVQGLKSNKRKKAIAAIVMSSLAVIVIIVQIIIAVVK